MAKMSEETTKGLVQARLSDIEGYPASQNVMENEIIWFKEDSYNSMPSYSWLSDMFDSASKKQTFSSKGIPDFIVIKKDFPVIVVIECKGDKKYHSSRKDISMYKTVGFGKSSETTKYGINGVLWYASFLKDDYDVIAVAVSGQTATDSRVTSFVWPKGNDISGIEVIEDGSLEECLVSIDEYQKDADTVLKRQAKTEDDVRKALKNYTLKCADFLRQNGIEDDSKAGFISAIILGLTNHDSQLYIDTRRAIDKKHSMGRMDSDIIGKNCVILLKDSLYGTGDYPGAPDYAPGIWDIDNIPKGKRTALKKFYDMLLMRDELIQAPRGKNSSFPDGDTFLSACIYSVYENVMMVMEKYRGMDVMGEFYTTFLRFTKGNAKEKGIVLTPHHITDLFCDIAEYYLGEPLTENTKIIDICCGTGAFLIAALSRIRRNIDREKISEEKKQRKYENARKNSLIGVERDASMYSLAYANMRFHGDGKASLFNCSSLVMDSYAPIDDTGCIYTDRGKKYLNEALKAYGQIDIGMINPPYSIDKKKLHTEREYKEVEDIERLENENRKLKKHIFALKKKTLQTDENELHRLEKKIQENEAYINKIKKDCEWDTMQEIFLQKGQSELDFVASMLHYLKKGGIGVAIVPMSCAGNGDAEMRRELLLHHTLLACMTMPPQLFFDSNVGTATCIMVFRAHIPQDPARSVFFGRWTDDGYTVIPHNGRKDRGRWKAIKSEWLKELDGTAMPDATTWVRENISFSDECLPEAYVKTPQSSADRESFEKTTRDYALFRFLDRNAAMDVKDRLAWVMDNYDEFAAGYAGACNEKAPDSGSISYKYFRLGDIVPDIHGGASYNASDLTSAISGTDYVSYITRTEQNNGISFFAAEDSDMKVERGGAITVGDTTSTVFYQEHEFVTGPHMIILRADWMNIYTSLYVVTMLRKEKYRYPVFGRAFTKDKIENTQLYLPTEDNKTPCYRFMADYIKSLPYSQNLI